MKKYFSLICMILITILLCQSTSNVAYAKTATKKETKVVFKDPPKEKGYPKLTKLQSEKGYDIYPEVQATWLDDMYNSVHLTTDKYDSDLNVLDPSEKFRRYYYFNEDNKHVYKDLGKVKADEKMFKKYRTEYETQQNYKYVKTFYGGKIHLPKDGDYYLDEIVDILTLYCNSAFYNYFKSDEFLHHSPKTTVASEYIYENPEVEDKLYAFKDTQIYMKNKWDTEGKNNSYSYYACYIVFDVDFY